MSSQYPITRFTYVPDEYFETVGAAFGAKPIAEWKLVPPQISFTLAIDFAPKPVTMKCVDGTDVRVASQPSIPDLLVFVGFNFYQTGDGR